jgi:hypothetical protein
VHTIPTPPHPPQNKKKKKNSPYTDDTLVWFPNVLSLVPALAQAALFARYGVAAAAASPVYAIVRGADDEEFDEKHSDDVDVDVHDEGGVTRVYEGRRAFDASDAAHKSGRVVELTKL